MQPTKRNKVKLATRGNCKIRKASGTTRLTMPHLETPHKTPKKKLLILALILLVPTTVLGILSLCQTDKTVNEKSIKPEQTNNIDNTNMSEYVKTPEEQIIDLIQPMILITGIIVVLNIVIKLFRY